MKGLFLQILLRMQPSQGLQEMPKISLFPWIRVERLPLCIHLMCRMNKVFTLDVRSFYSAVLADLGDIVFVSTFLWPYLLATWYLSCFRSHDRAFDCVELRVSAILSWGVVLLCGYYNYFCFFLCLQERGVVPSCLIFSWGFSSIKFVNLMLFVKVLVNMSRVWNCNTEVNIGLNYFSTDM